MFSFFRKKPPAPVIEPKRKKSFFSTHSFDEREPRLNIMDVLSNLTRTQPMFSGGYAQDDSSDGFPAFKTLGNSGQNMSEVLVEWYASQGFIGHQLAGILAQHWLINKACTMPGDDAIRKGYSVVSVDGEDLPPDAVKMINRYDRAFGIKKHMREFVRKGRIFGVRVAMFKIESTDPQYYEKPFNIDGVTKGAYKGIVQIDPYWTAPMLDQAGSSQPDSLHFYEPVYWMINGKRVHRSHLIIFRHAEPIDALKPQYLYGGIPLPQQIMERVYASERTANEAPQLATSKRTNIWLTDMEAVMADSAKATQRLSDWAYYRDNYGIKLGDKENDEFQQFDTALADFDALIMTQYQLVAAQAGVPATKLIGTTPKGFNSTGEYEEASYHELLESIQAHDLTPLLERHHELVMKAYVLPSVKDVEDVQISVLWLPLDSPTAKELADTNLVKAQIGAALIASGAISSEEERQRVALDKESGYHEMGLEEQDAPGLEDGPDDDDRGDSGSDSAFDHEFVESEHPRSENGEFGSGGGVKKNSKSVASAASKSSHPPFEPQKTSQDVAKFAVENGYVDHADFGKLHADIANDHMQSLSDHLQEFPKLRESQNFAGSMQSYLTKLHEQKMESMKQQLIKKTPALASPKMADQLEKYLQDNVKKPKAPAGVWAFSASQDGKRGVSFSEQYGSSAQMEKLVSGLRSDVESKFHPVGCDTIKSVADHEYGHQLDALLGLSGNKEVNQLRTEAGAYEDGDDQSDPSRPASRRQAITASVSGYANENIEEFIAECWMEYRNNPEPRPIAKRLGEIVKSEYTRQFPD